MPLSIESPQSPGPISPDQPITIVVTDPDGATEGPLLYVMALFDDGTLEHVVYESAGQDAYTITTPEANHQVIERAGGWPRSFTILDIGSNIYPAPFQSAVLRFRLASGVLSNPVAQEMALARQKIEALPPLVRSTHPFHAISGGMPLDEEPATAARLFEVVLGEDAPLALLYMADRSRRISRTFRVRVRHDGANNEPELHDAIASDDDAIAFALEQPPYASGVHLVTLKDARTEAKDGFAIRTLTFEAEYVAVSNPG